MHTDGRTDRQPKEIPSVPRVETKLLPRSRVAIPGCEAAAAEDPASDRAATDVARSSLVT